MSQYNQDKNVSELMDYLNSFEKNNFEKENFGFHFPNFANMFRKVTPAHIQRMAPADHAALIHAIGNAAVATKANVSTQHAEGNDQHQGDIVALKRASKGTLNIRIKRNSHNLSFDLPCPLFAPTDQTSNWNGVLSPYLPAAGSPTISYTTTNTTLVIKYMIGSSYDTITIDFTGSNNNYNTFLQQLNGGSSWFETKMAQLVINDPSQTDQLNSTQWSDMLYFAFLNQLGKKSYNEYLPLEGQNEYMQLHNQVHIFFEGGQKIDKNGAHILLLNQQNTQLNYNVYISDKAGISI
jgi:hypothetical protein